MNPLIYTNLVMVTKILHRIKIEICRSEGVLVVL